MQVRGWPLGPRQSSPRLRPRRLTLTLDGAVLHLAVANRRLQAMLAPAPAIEGAADLAGVALPDVEDAHVPALRTVLDQILALPGPVAMTARRLDVAFASDIGIPANLLGRAWGVEDVGQTEALAPSELMRKFLDDLGDDALAWLRIEGEEVADQSHRRFALCTARPFHDDDFRRGFAALAHGQ